MKLVQLLVEQPRAGSHEDAGDIIASKSQSGFRCDDVVVRGEILTAVGAEDEAQIGSDKSLDDAFNWRKRPDSSATTEWISVSSGKTDGLSSQ